MNNTRPIDNILIAEKESLFRLGRELFACPELGFKEVKSNEIITSFLCRNKIPFETGLSLTGVKAALGENKGYHIALVADMDALLAGGETGKRPFHSCGHSVQVTIMLYVMKLLKETGILEKTGGRVSFIAAPAEEFIDFSYREKLKREGKIKYFSGKQNMISDGVFDDIDCVISAHINGETDTLFDINSTLSGFMVKKAIFRGKASHSGAAPHLGRNAFHGASLCMNGLAYMKDQFPPQAGVSIHPVLTGLSGSVNIIPDEAALESYVRANTMEELLEAGRKFDNCAVHCAKALGLECEIIDQTGYMPLKQSREISDVVYGHMLEICDESKIVKNVVSGASGDVGDLGYLLPTVQFGFSGMEGRIHSSEFKLADEENVYVNTVKIVYETVKDILTDPKLQVRYHDYKDRKKFYLDNWLHEETDLNHDK